MPGSTGTMCSICGCVIESGQSRVMYWPEGMPYPGTAHRKCRDEIVEVEPVIQLDRIEPAVTIKVSQPPLGQ